MINPGIFNDQTEMVQIIFYQSVCITLTDFLIVRINRNPLLIMIQKSPGTIDNKLLTG